MEAMLEKLKGRSSDKVLELTDQLREAKSLDDPNFMSNLFKSAGGDTAEGQSNHLTKVKGLIKKYNESKNQKQRRAARKELRDSLSAHPDHFAGGLAAVSNNYQEIQ